MTKEPNFYEAKNLSEAIFQLKNISELNIVGGCTQICHEQNGDFFDLPGNILCLKNIGELTNFSRTERRLEFGAATPLAKIETRASSGKIPGVLLEAIKSIATPAIRNFATIGGNLCSPGCKKTLYAPLLALDAILEFKNDKETKLVPMQKFEEQFASLLPQFNMNEFFKDFMPENSGTTEKKRYLLSKVIVPLQPWTLEHFSRFNRDSYGNEYGFSQAILVEDQKGIVSDFRIALAGPFVFRDRDLENLIIGSKLPLSQKFVSNFMAKTEERFDEVFKTSDFYFYQMDKTRFLNSIRNVLRGLML